MVMSKKTRRKPLKLSKVSPSPSGTLKTPLLGNKAPLCLWLTEFVGVPLFVYINWTQETVMAVSLGIMLSAHTPPVSNHTQMLEFVLVLCLLFCIMKIITAP